MVMTRLANDGVDSARSPAAKELATIMNLSLPLASRVPHSGTITCGGRLFLVSLREMILEIP